jgi:hypothetical protein
MEEYSTLVAESGRAFQLRAQPKRESSFPVRHPVAGTRQPQLKRCHVPEPEGRNSPVMSPSDQEIADQLVEMLDRLQRSAQARPITP